MTEYSRGFQDALRKAAEVARGYADIAEKNSAAPWVLPELIARKCAALIESIPLPTEVPEGGVTKAALALAEAVDQGDIQATRQVLTSLHLRLLRSPAKPSLSGFLRDWVAWALIWCTPTT